MHKSTKNFKNFCNTYFFLAEIGTAEMIKKKLSKNTDNLLNLNLTLYYMCLQKILYQKRNDEKWRMRSPTSHVRCVNCTQLLKFIIQITNNHRQMKWY